MEIEKSELEFKQQVRVSPINLFIPDFYEKMFIPGYIPVEKAEDVTNDVFFPTSDEDFEAMIAAFEEEEAEQERLKVFSQKL